MNFGPRAHAAITGTVKVAILPGPIERCRHRVGRCYAVQRSATSPGLGQVIVTARRGTTWVEVTEAEVESAGLESILDVWPEDAGDDDPVTVLTIEPTVEQRLLPIEHGRVLIGHPQYTDQTQAALRDEPEAVPAEYQRRLSLAASTRDDELRRRRRADDLARLRELRGRAAKAGVDVTDVLDRARLEIESRLAAA